VDGATLDPLGAQRPSEITGLSPPYVPARRPLTTELNQYRYFLDLSIETA
jgi:hypothetical protein